jgi:CBS domain-containing protein
MPIMEVILLLCRSRNILPVVEKSDGRLVGVVSSWQAVRAIAGS